MMLSVIMPARNEAQFIAAAIHSALDQSAGMKIEVIVVDDGSTDDTAAIVTGLRDQGQAIRLINGPQKGISAARNAGLDALSPATTLVAFLDGDDMLPPGRFARDVTFFAASPATQGVYGRMRLVTTDKTDMRAEVTPDDPVVFGFQMGAGLYRRSAIDRVGRFDPRFVLAEDMDFLLRMWERKPMITLIDEVSVLYRQHAGNITKRKADVQRHSMLAMLEHSRRLRADPTLHKVDWMVATGKMPMTGGDLA